MYRVLLTSILFLTALTPAVTAQHFEHHTTNFVTRADDEKTARLIGQRAEKARRDLAVAWLGKELAAWKTRCVVTVTVNMEGPCGATTFRFGEGRVLDMTMEIKGPLDRLLTNVLPHEIAHTIFAHHFRCPVPRWADEGGSVLSEDGVQQKRHDRLLREILNNQRQIRLRDLLSIMDYPRDVMSLYAQGYSVSDFLVRQKDRATFLAFVDQGMKSGWDKAAKACYGHESVEQLEEAWLQHVAALPDEKRW